MMPATEPSSVKTAAVMSTAIESTMMPAAAGVPATVMR
jgi:hypothetical protein